MQLMGRSNIVSETLGHPTLQATVHAPAGVRVLLVTIYGRYDTLRGTRVSVFWMN